jgi:hypothetical protein
MRSNCSTRCSPKAWLIAASLAVGPGFSNALAEETTPTSICVDVRIDREQFYACLNQELQDLVSASRPAAHLTPNPADSPPPTVGTFNQAAIRERMGTAFGHSVVSQRPVSPTSRSLLGLPHLP